MRKILKIAGNELRALFCSPVAWFILVIFAVQSGMTFTDLFRSVLRQQFMGEPIEYSITTALLTGMSGTFTVIQQYLYLYVPLLTMGLMSREFGSGSIKLLYSSPVTAGQIIWGKFLSMMVYGLILMGVLLVLVLFACCTVESFDLSAALSGGGGCCHVRGFGFPELRGKNRTGSSFYSGHHVLAVNFRAFRRVNQRFDQQ